MKCVFCEIARNIQPADIVYENERTMAFLDIRPLFPGHVLLIPKDHYETIWDMPDDLLALLTTVAKRLSNAIRKAADAEGIFIANNNIVSQSVPHFHIHLVPRNKKDGLKGFFWPRQNYLTNEHKIAMKNRIIEMLD